MDEFFELENKTIISSNLVGATEEEIIKNNIQKVKECICIILENYETLSEKRFPEEKIKKATERLSKIEKVINFSHLKDKAFIATNNTQNFSIITCHYGIMMMYMVMIYSLLGRFIHAVGYTSDYPDFDNFSEEIWSRACLYWIYYRT